MLFLGFFITAFTAVLSEDLLGVSYYFDDNYFDTFSEKQCVNSTQWNLVSYGHLGLSPPYEGRYVSLRASRNSCTTSFPIVFLNGTLELTVYLRTISRYSGITVAVYDRHDEAMVSVRYQRSNRNFVPGWVVISVPIHKHTTGYVQLLGQSLDSEFVIVDSLHYAPDNATHYQNNEEIQSDISDRVKTTTKNESDQVVTTFNENGVSFSEINEDDIDGSGSGDYETEPTITEDPDTEDPDAETEDPIIDNSTEEPSTEDSGNSNSEEDDGFWNVFTITFVSVGAFTVVGLVGVGSYYIGKSRGISQNPPPLDLESIEPPSEMIPRARSIFSDATPYDRFSRYS